MKIYEFQNGKVLLDASDGTLRDPGGDVIDLRPQTREVLRLLALAPDRTVTKAEFAEAVWGGRQVSEDSLVQCVAEIRTALGDGKRQVIQTVPRKGYRFVHPGAPVAKRPSMSLRSTGLFALLLICGLVLGYFVFPRDSRPSPPPVVAVLPLEDLSPAPHKGYLSDALSEGIITELARFPQFRVIARNSSFQFRDAPTDVREIGRVLGAGYVIEGSQQYGGKRLRVTIQLVETGTGAHIISDQFERDLHDLFVVQTEIVRHVASTVGETVMLDLPDRTGGGGVDSLLRGMQARKLMSQLSHKNWKKAIALERTSVRQEPDSEWGYIGASLMLGVAAQLGWMKPRGEVLAEAREMAETAMRLAPENYMSHYTMGRLLSRTGQLDEAVLHFQRAIELNPSDSLVLIGMSRPLLHLGETDRAIEVLHRAKAVDPLHGDWLRWQLGWAYWQKGECKRGLEAMQSMNAPPLASNKTLVTIHVCLGQILEAREVMGRFLAEQPDHTLAREVETLPRMWKPEGTTERYLEALRKAGMP